MTRDEAKVAMDRTALDQPWRDQFIDWAVALGMLKLDEPKKPNEPIFVHTPHLNSSATPWRQYGYMVIPKDVK